MKNVINRFKLSFGMVILSLLAGTYAFGQSDSGATQSSGSSSSMESHTTTSVTSGASTATTAPPWYNSPWVWAIGALVLIILLLLIFRGKNASTSEVTHTVKSTTEVKED